VASDERILGSGEFTEHLSVATLTSHRKSLIHECVTGQRVTAADVTVARRGEAGSMRSC